MILKEEIKNHLKDKPLVYVFAYLVKYKPGHNQKYYYRVYSELIGMGNTSCTKYFKRLEEEGYIIKNRKGHENILTYSEDAPPMENLILPSIEEQSEWNNIGKDGLVEW